MLSLARQNMPVVRLKLLGKQNLPKPDRFNSSIGSTPPIPPHYYGCVPPEIFKPEFGKGPYLLNDRNEAMLDLISAYGAALEGFSPHRS